MTKIRFKQIADSAGTEAEVMLGAGHTVRRSKVWHRSGGWQFVFECSCGWNTRNRFQVKDNAMVERHAALVKSI